MLGGAKNHMTVLPHADIDMAADAAVERGAAPSAGERCMAISPRSEAVGDAADRLV